MNTTVAISAEFRQMKIIEEIEMWQNEDPVSFWYTVPKNEFLIDQSYVSEQ